jgi:hypothetical protein
MADCIRCEVSPSVVLNGQSLCAEHAEQWADLSARETPPIAYAPYVKVKPVCGVVSHTPRHYK